MINWIRITRKSCWFLYSNFLKTNKGKLRNFDTRKRFLIFNLFILQNDAKKFFHLVPLDCINQTFDTQKKKEKKKEEEKKRNVCI